MFKHITLLFLSLNVLLFSSCQDRQATVVPAIRDSTITEETSFSRLFFDSAEIETFISQSELPEIHQQQISNFYKRRNYQFAWFTENGLAEHTRSFWSLHNNYIETFQDTSLEYRALHHQIDGLMNSDSKITPAQVRQMEWQLTVHFFAYASNAYAGQLDPEKLQWHIPRKKIDHGGLLDSLILTKGNDLGSWEPVNRFYSQLRSALIRYQAISRAGGWINIPFKKQDKLKQGDSANVIALVKKRMTTTGEYTDDTTLVYNAALFEAVRRAQKRFGMKEDGIITQSFVNELNVPVDARIKQILINLERMRWVPEQPKGPIIIVNIPEYRLHVLENDTRVFSMNIVAGKAANNTVIFSGNIKYVVFSPYWNVPPNIVRNEILPAIKRNPGYLAASNMEQTGVSNGLPVIRQKPGPGNALGKVKFIFPNSYNIYLHDSPAKTLFNEQNRAFSHGCIRVAEPARLAAFLLRKQPQWTEETMNAAMNAGVEKWVGVLDPVPVLLTYFTAWAGGDGQVNFRKDVYGHDLLLAKSLFQSK